MVSFSIHCGASWFQTHNVCVSFAEFKGIMHDLGRRFLSGGSRLVDTTTETGGDGTVGSPGRPEFLSKKTYKVRKSDVADEPVRFVVNGPTDAASEPSHFWCRICRKDVSLLTEGPYEVFGFFMVLVITYGIIACGWRPWLAGS